MTDITFTKTAADEANVPFGTVVRSDASSEGGHTGAAIQHVKLDDGTGKATTKITQDVIADNSNSTALPLNAGNSYRFTGGTSSTLGVAGIQVSLFADKNCTIQVQQSPTDAPSENWDITDTFYYTASGNFGTTVQAISSFYRVVVTTNSEITGTFRLQSALCPVVEAVPRALDLNGNFRIASPTDEYGFRSENTPQGDLRTVMPYRLVGAQMDFVANAGSPDSSFWLTNVDATAGPGSVTVSNSLCSLNSGTNAASFSRLVSVRKARYVTGYTNRFRGNVRLSTNQASNTKRWGVANYSNYRFTITAATASVGDIYSNNSQYFTVMQPCAGGTTLYCFGTGAPSTGNLTKVSGAAGSTSPIAFSAGTAAWTVSDGALFQMAGSTFTCQIFKNGTATPVTNFNGHLGGAYTPDSNIHTYEIYYTNTNVYFVVDSALLHIYSATTTGWAATMHHYIYADNVDSGNTTNTILGIRNAAIHRLGLEHTEKISRNLTAATATILKVGPGILRNVVLNSYADGATLTLYDGLVAISPLATITIGKPTQAAVIPVPVQYDSPFYTGLTVTITGTMNVTIGFE
jgi:hypothetical protein